jgi:hypothetical protein
LARNIELKINCLHGYFIFEEQRAGEVSDFMSTFGLSLVRKDNYFTFEDIADAPDFSIAGKPYLNTIATMTFAGQPWEVFEANGLVYNYDTGLMVPIELITQIISLDTAGNFYLSSGLILPGSLTDEGSRVKEYAAWFSIDTMKFKYSEVSYVD